MCKSNRLLYKLQIMSYNLQLLTEYNLLVIYPELFITQLYHNFTCNIIPVLLKASSQKYIQKTSFVGMKEWMKCISLHLKKRSRNSVSSAARYAFTNHFFIVTSPQHKCLGEWNSWERAPDSAKKLFTYRQYILTQNTHTYTQYTQCTIKTYLVINTHYTPYVHIYT